jgi:cytochrome c553
MPMRAYCKNQHRSREERKDILITVGVCSHLGCSPGEKFKSDPQAQFAFIGGQHQKYTVAQLSNVNSGARIHNRAMITIAKRLPQDEYRPLPTMWPV